MIEDILASWWWLILAALGLPSALTGFFIRRMEKRLDKREAQRKKEQDRERYEKEKLWLLN